MAQTIVVQPSADDIDIFNRLAIPKA